MGGLSYLLESSDGRLLYLFTNRPFSMSNRRPQIISNSSVPGRRCQW